MGYISAGTAAIAFAGLFSAIRMNIVNNASSNSSKSIYGYNESNTYSNSNGTSKPIGNTNSNGSSLPFDPDDVVISDSQFGRKFAEHGIHDYGLAGESGRNVYSTLINETISSPSEVRLGPWSGQQGDCFLICIIIP